MTRSCSWCHTENPDTEIDCRECGHGAHVPRLLCTCPKCCPPAVRQRAEAARDFEPASGRVCGAAHPDGIERCILAPGHDGHHSSAWRNF